MTKQELLVAILEVNDKLGHVPSLNQLAQNANVSRNDVRMLFGTYVRALRECNLARSGRGQKVEMEALWRDWAGVARKLRKIPTMIEYEQLGRYSQNPYTRRFGHWLEVPHGLKQFAEEQGQAGDWQDVLAMIVERKRESGRDKPASMEATIKDAGALIGRPMYGPFLRPYPLICGPINEAGVIFLFGVMAERLGFVVMRIQSGFPDCEAMRLVEEERCQMVRIEFEYESRNFLRHMHDAKQCDMIVCWRHNWPECPLEVLELRKEVERMVNG
jgi:hypothetical protein